MESATAGLPWLTGHPVQGAWARPWCSPQDVLAATRVGGEGLGGGGAPFLPGAEAPTEGLFAPSWQLDLTLEPPLSVLFIFPFLGVGFKLSYFVYIAPKFYGTKDLQVQICPAFINSPSFLIYVISIFLPCTVN